MKPRFKTIKMFQVNGAWYAKTKYGAQLLKFCGLERRGGYLSLSVVANHCAIKNVCVVGVPK
jgi:hypothetical protein